jgi:hypothetical protein
MCEDNIKIDSEEISCAHVKLNSLAQDRVHSALFGVRINKYRNT